MCYDLKLVRLDFMWRLLGIQIWYALLRNMMTLLGFRNQKLNLRSDKYQKGNARTYGPCVYLSHAENIEE